MTYTDADLREKTPPEKAAGTDKQGGDNKEYGLSLGGPIIKDRLHFFLTYEGKEFTTPNTILSPIVHCPDGNRDSTTPRGLTPELRENYGPVANPFDEDLFFAKLDWQISASDSLELSGQSRAADAAGRRGRRVRRVRGIHLHQRRRALCAALGARGRQLLQRCGRDLRRHQRLAVEGGRPAGQQFVALNARDDGFNPILQVDGVDPRTYFFSAQSGWSIQDDITFTEFDWLGEHTIKSGVKFKDVELEVRDASTEALYSYLGRAPIPPTAACRRIPSR